VKGNKVEKQIKIQEQTDEQLKVIAYDLLVQVQQLQNALNQVQQELINREVKGKEK